MHIKKSSAQFGIGRSQQTARKLREIEARSRLLLDSVSNGIWELDLEGRVTFVNLEAARALGYTPRELIGKMMHETVHHSYPDGVRYPLGMCPMHATLIDGKSRICLDEVLWRKDGTSFPVEYSTYPLLSRGARIGAAVVFQDVTERKLVEKKSQLDQARLSALIDSAMDAIVSMDEDQNITLFNHAAERMFGYRAADIIGQPLERLLPVRLRAAHGSHVRIFGGTGVSTRTMNGSGSALMGLRADGEAFFLEASISKIEVDGGNTYTAILRDITQRKQAEAQAEKSQRLLQAISDAQSHFITGSEHRSTFDSVLKILLDYSCSEYGFIGEVFRDEAGHPYLKAHAITNIAWNAKTRALFEQHAEQGLEFRNLNTLFGKVMTTGKAVISNDPAHDPRAGGLPHGHPAMHAFLGLPLYNGAEMIGMLGVANRRGGYDDKFCDELSPLAAACAGLIGSWREYGKRRQAEDALQQSNQRFEAVLKAVPDLMFELDAQGNYLNVWGGRTDPLAMPAHQMVGRNVEDVLPAPAAEVVLGALAEAEETNFSFGRKIKIALPQGDKWFELSVAKQATEGKARFVVLSRDITRRTQNEEGLQLAVSVYQSSREGILVTDENNEIIDVNPAFTVLTGYTLDEVRGKNPRMFSSDRHDAEFYRQMWQSISESGYWQGEIWDKRRDGETHAKWLNISVIRHPDGSVFRHVAQFSDITEKKRQDEKIWAQANFDALTGLPNRSLLADRVHQAMSSGARSSMYGALLSLDLDHFKQLNDTFGHSMGDQLLTEVARRLSSCVREEDTVARMGGDEFIVVLNELSRDQNEAAVQAEIVGEKIRGELSRPYQLDKTEYHSSSSVGIALFRGHSDSYEALLAHVDVAMYQAKAKGRNAICFFDASMQVAIEQRSLLEAALRVALERGEFALHYQLQIDNAGNYVGVEALLRWQHPQLGMVSPAQFIPVAEESGLILPIGLWVLETACAQLARWQDMPAMRHLRIAVNVSVRQFREAAFVDQVKDVLQRAGIRPEVLKLELTESLVLDNVEECIAKMKALKALGLRFSMDDFGTGYSSLSYLSRLPIDQLKIDQSFVRDITTDRNDAAIVYTIISMGHSLGLDVIAEGVETQAQRDFLEQRGCMAYQGYLYSRPLPIDLLEQKLAGRL